MIQLMAHLKFNMQHFWILVFCLSSASWPSTGFADTDAASFGETNEDCEYTGFLGAPFPGVPACEEGRTTDMPSCMDCTRGWFPERDEKIECEDPTDCVHLVSKFMACAGPIGPFAVDDDDNIYFWAGRWTLHSLDSRGNLRWRYKFCNPPGDSLCTAVPDDCQPQATRMVPMVMDYYGTMFFFIGDIFYAINADGHLLLKRRIDIPEVPVAPEQYLSIGDGPAELTGNAWYNSRGAPVLHRDGTISAAFGITMYSRTNKLLRSGVIKLSREGTVIDTGHFLWKSDPPKWMETIRLTGTDAEQLAISGRRSSGTRGSLDEGGDYAHGAFYALDDLAPAWEMELPFGYSEETGRDHDEIESDLAVGPHNRVFGMTYHGVVYAFDMQHKVGKAIFNFHDSEALSWQNRPIIAADGTMYLAYERYPLGPGVLWAMDTEKLWNNPVAQRSNPRGIADPDDYEGLKWRRVYTGAGGWTTPVLSKNGRLYEAMGGIGALDPETGAQIWRFGERTMASAPTILSDGTIVVGQGITGRIFYLREDTPNGGMADEGWPSAMHDQYLSNNAAHPFRWDRSGEPPYPPLEALLAEAGPCWNEVDWDVDACGPLPDHTDRDIPDEPDAGDVDDTTTPGTDIETPESDITEGSDIVDQNNDADIPAPQPRTAGGCAGCSTCASGCGIGYLLPLVLLSAIGAFFFLRRIRHN